MFSPNSAENPTPETSELPPVSPSLSPSLSPPMAAPLPPLKPLPIWRLWIPLIFQIILVISLPAQVIYTHLTGKTIILQTMPVDPYDLLRGYSQTLSYEISRPETLKKLPGWENLPADPASCSHKTPCSTANHPLKPGINLYIILESPKAAHSSGQPQPWKPVAVSAKLPENLPKNQIALEGKSHDGTIEYGLETYYMPEDQRQKINDAIQAAQLKNPRSFVVEVKVNSQGKSAALSLWIQGHSYQF